MSSSVLGPGIGQKLAYCCNVARAIVRQQLHFVERLLASTKPRLHRLHHQISNKIGIDPFGRRHPTDDFLVRTVQHRREA